MNRVIMIGLVVVLLLSLSGVGFLTYQYSVQRTTIDRLHKDLEQTNGELSQTKKELSQTEGQLSNVKADLADSRIELDKQQKSIDQLQADNSATRRELVRLRYINCGKSIADSDVASISTNQGLVDLLTRTVEADYSFTSVNTTFDLIWNNSKTAKFSIVDQERATVEVIVSWDFNTSRVIGIYNINRGCIYYLD